VAFTAAQLSSEVRSAYSKDKPIFLGENILEGVTPANAVWRSWTNSFPFPNYTVGGATYDATDTAYPTSRLSDRLTSARSRALLPGGISPNNDRWAFVFLSAEFSFDSIAILEHNFGTLSKQYGTYNSGNTFEINIGLSDDGSNWTIIETFTDPLTDKPLVSFDLANGSGSPSSYAQFSGATYGAVSIRCVGAAMGSTPSTLPEIGEVVFGKRMQLLHGPIVPYEDRNIGSEVIRYSGSTGTGATFTRYAGRRIVNANYYLTTNDKGNFLTFYEDHIDHGLKQFLYVPKGSQAAFPASYGGAEPGEAYWMSLQEDQLNLPVDDVYFLNKMQLGMRENAPFNSGVQ